MGGQAVLERPPTVEPQAPAGPPANDNYPTSNARGQFRGLNAANDNAAAELAEAEEELATAQRGVAAAEGLLAADGAAEGATWEFDWVPIVGWGAAALAVGTAGYALYQLHQAKQAEAAAQAKKKKAEEDAKAQPQTKPETNVEVKDKKPQQCLVDEYAKLKKICGGEAHHMMIDMVYRLGGRPTGAATNSTADRIPNAPTFNQSMAICLTDAQHAGLHSALKGQLDALGASQTPAGTAPMSKITPLIIASIAGIPGLDAKCKALAIAKLTGQLAQQGIKGSQPGRTAQAPLPSGQAATVLRRGSY